ncbi:hypothetical protein N2152v2_011015 [Parachlorella kessleri]
MGIGQKIKDVLTPGPHHEEKPGAETGVPGSYGTTGTTGTTGYGTTAATGTTGYGTTGATTGVTDYGTTVGGEDVVERRTEEAAYEEAAATGRPAVAQTVTTAEAAPARAAPVAAGTEAVCGQEFFTKTEDRPVVKERVDYIKEHRPVEKEFVVETRATGAARQLPGEVEHLGTTERVVSEATPKGPCE